MDEEWTYESIWAECDRIGEDEVERGFKTGRWWGGREIAVEQWQKKKRDERQRIQTAATERKDVQTLFWVKVAGIATAAAAVIAFIDWLWP